MKLQTTKMDKAPESCAGFGIIANEIIKTNGDNRKRHMVNLSPAPLFRTVGLMGLSANLPPHRRLRSVLNTTTDQSHRNSTLNGLRCIKVKPLPKILHANPQKDEISMNKQLQTVDRQLNTTARARCRDTRIRTEREEYLFEEVWREQAPKVTRKKNKHVKIRHEEVSDLSRWIQSLEITDSKRKQTTKQHWNDASGRGKWAGSLCRGVGQTRRDRRPHFLPPITQSDCLLNVPLLLPDNSPPPSPCSPSDILFFPLPVPHIQPFSRERRGDAPAQPD